MNVVQILPELNIGGVETGVFDFSIRLAKLGHRSIIISNGGELVKQLELQGVKHFLLPVHKKSPITIFKMIWVVKKILEDEKVQIVHARSRVPAIIGYYAARRTGIPFITTCHGYYSKHPISGIMGWGKYVIAISQIIAKHMMEDFKVPYRRIKLIYRGVDFDRFKYTEPDGSGKREFVIGMIGRISPIKGHAFFLRSVSRAIKVIPRLKVLIVGDAPPDKAKYGQHLEDLVRRLGLTKYVEFLGRRNDIPEILSRMDLLVLATVTQEAFGRVIIEAFASGVPVLATSVGGVTEIIRDGENGLLVPPEDPQSMADGIVKILKDRRLSKKLAKQARRDAEEKFSLKKMTDDTIEVYEEAIRTKRILIIKIGAVGDCVLATPSLRAVRQKNPKAFIAILIGLEGSQILKGCPYVDEMIVYDRKGKDKGWRRFFKLASDIKGYGFDETIDLQNNLRSHLFAYLSSAPKRYGYKKGKLWLLLNRRIRHERLPLPPVEHQFRVLEMLGLDTKGATYGLELWPTSTDEDYVKRIFESEWVREGQILIGINPSASPRWVTKRWPLENFAQICDALAQDKVRTVLIGSKSDAEFGIKLASIAKSKPINLIGRTSLSELAALMKRLACLITSDSAPMHIAAAMNTPFVALFGPTDPLRHLPPTKNCAVITKGLKCAPCYKPACSDIRCMREITVGEVLKAVKEIVKR
ncbi:MAG: hypothetical protein AMJ78_10175 [Omnitrophica WOR_2 bacterium SM23_29]|nr:MAG: hypothetical protein AMJ78_10175 [Omnitrophica WOR_2 bacterium SM23_29]